MKKRKNPVKYNEPLTYESNIELEEEFRKVYIVDYGYITINNLGTKIYTKTGRFPAIYEDEFGYLGAYVGTNTGPHHFLRLHRMVALAFIENPDNLPEVNHKNLNKKNNCVTNLEWITTLDNNRHARLNGKMQGLKGSKNGRSKLTEEQVKEIKENFTGKRGEIAQLSKKYEVSWSLIKLIVTEQNWKHV